jgi:hypothetical protein
LPRWADDENQRIESRIFANPDLNAGYASLYAGYEKLMTRIRMYQAEEAGDKYEGLSFAKFGACVPVKTLIADS